MVPSKDPVGLFVIHYRVGRGKFKLPVEGESITPIISKPIVRETVWKKKTEDGPS